MRFTPQMRQLDWLVNRPIAHRGLHDAGVPENSSAAFAAAISNGYSIECDIQLTADGEAVVFHDDTLDRMTSETGVVQTRTAKELCSLTLGNSRCHMQTLGEMLDQVSGRTTLVIEIKYHWKNQKGLTLRALEVLKSYGGPYALMSFDPAIISLLAERAPDTVRGIVADRVVDTYYQAISIHRRIAMRQFLHLEDTTPHFVSFDANGLPFEPVQQIRAAGFPVITWTITTEKMAERVRRYADQITFESYLPQ
jgi:glycerophosphoryl diester phosphodiesterase